MLPYGRQSVDDSDVAAVVEVLHSDWLTTGPWVRRFEERLAALAGTPGAVTVTSGTAALHTAYAALGVGPGDEVVTTPLTFVATASGATALGADVVFADISPDTGNLDPEAVEAALTPRSRVVSAVDYGGHPIDAPGLRRVTDDRELVLLEDAAHSIGGSLDGVPVGSLADVTTFSFFPTKNLTTAEGGAVVSRDPEVLVRAATFRNIGMIKDPGRMRRPTDEGWWYEVHDVGLNYRLPDVLAALGASQLDRLEAFSRRRREIHQRYCAGLADLDALVLPPTREGAAPTWHLYSLRIRDGRRRELFDHLRSHGVGRAGQLHPRVLAPPVRGRGLSARHVPPGRGVLRAGDLPPAVPGPHRRRRRQGRRPGPRVRG